MKKSFALYTLLLLSVPLFAQQPKTIWEKQYKGNNGYFEANHIVKTSDNGYVITGRAESTGFVTGLLKIDSQGEKQWLRTFGSDSVQMSSSFSFERNSDIITVGYIDPHGIIPPLFFKGFLYTYVTDLSGKQKNLHYEYNEEGSLNNSGSLIKVRNGGYFQAGASRRAKDSGAIVLRRMSEDTKPQWERHINKIPKSEGVGFYGVAGVGELSNGYVIHAGKYESIPYIVVIRTDSEGKKTFEKTITGGDIKTAVNLTVTSNDGYALLTHSEYKSPQTEKWRTDVIVYNFDKDNEKVFQHTITDTTVDYVFSSTLQQTPDGGFVIGGFTAMKNSDPTKGEVNFATSRFYLRKIDASGKLQWHKGWGKEGISSVLRYVMVGNDGSYIVGGMQGEELYLAKIQESGTSVVSETLQLDPVLSVSPNPIGAEKAEIHYTVRTSGNTKITVLNELGQEVRVIASQQMEPGTYSAFVDAGDLPNGMYFLRCTNGQYSTTQKLVITK